MSPTFELTEDQQTVQKWLHEFAADVIRPAAAEYDEREETPWPVIQEAAKAGIYSMEFFAEQWGDESGLSIPITMEELFWGDAGIGLSIVGTTLGVAAILGNGTGEQIGEWVPQCFGTADDIKIASLCVSEPNAGSDVSSIKTRARYDEASDEWVLDGVKTWATNGGIADVHVVVAAVDPELGSRGQASFVIGPDSKGKGLSQGQKFQKMGIRASHTAEVVLDGCRIPGRQLLGGKEKLDARMAKARERLKAAEGPATGAGGTTKAGDRKQAAMATFEASRPAVGAQAVGIARAAYEYALEYAGTREQFGAADHHEPGRRLPARRHEDPGRRRPPARLARRLDGTSGQAVPQRRGLDEQALRRGDGGQGHRAGDPGPRRQRLHPGVPGRALAPRLEDLHHLRGHQRDPAPHHQPRDQRPPDPLTPRRLRADG